MRLSNSIAHRNLNTLEEFIYLKPDRIVWMKILTDNEDMLISKRTPDKWCSEVQKIVEETIHQCLPNPRCSFSTSYEVYMRYDEDQIWRRYMRFLLNENENIKKTR